MLLDVGGVYQVRVDGERHLWTPESVYKLQSATRLDDYGIYKEYAALINDQSTGKKVPIPGVTVTVAGADGAALGEAVTDAQGVALVLRVGAPVLRVGRHLIGRDGAKLFDAVADVHPSPPFTSSLRSSNASTCARRLGRRTRRGRGPSSRP